MFTSIAGMCNAPYIYAKNHKPLARILKIKTYNNFNITIMKMLLEILQINQHALQNNLDVTCGLKKERERECW